MYSGATKKCPKVTMFKARLQVLSVSMLNDLLQKCQHFLIIAQHQDEEGFSLQWKEFEFECLVRILEGSVPLDSIKAFLLVSFKTSNLQTY